MLKRKYYKTGESRKLSSRKTGPWEIIEKLSNGVNFRIKNNSTGKSLVVHHDRLIPVKFEPEANESNDNEENAMDFDISSDSEDEGVAIEHEPLIENRYPTRNRNQRIIEGAIPWDAIQL